MTRWLLTIALVAVGGCATGVPVGAVSAQRPLDAPERQPVRLVIIAAQTSSVRRWLPTGERPEAAADTVGVGTTGVTPGSALTSDTERAFVRFDLTALPPNAQIEEAVLVLTPVDAGPDWGAWTLTATRTGPTPPHSWGDQPDALGDACRALPVANATIEADVTPIVRAWRSGAPNHGLVLRGNPEGAPRHLRIYTETADRVAQMPRLVVTYVP